MAKKSIETVEEQYVPRKKKKKKWGILIVGAVVVGLSVTVYLNRDKVAIYVKDIPVLNRLFKSNEEALLYENVDKSELISKLNEAEKNIQSLNQMIDEQKEQNARNQEQIKVLKEYEQQYSQFKEQKMAWDANIAKTNPELYLKQFETINPEHAAEIYKELKQADALHKDYKKYANIIGNMDEAKAAEALEELLTTAPVLVKQIFEYMDTERQSLILSNMTTTGAAQVIKLTSPELE